MDRLSRKIKGHIRFTKAKGFTLIELMIVVSLLAVMATVGIPAFLNFSQTNLVAATANRFVSSLAIARSEAIKRNTNITLCRFRQVGANFQCTNDGLWEQGWAVWIDLNGDGDIDNNEWLKQEGALPAGYTLRSSTNTFVSTITYSSSGDATGDFGNNPDILRLCEPSQNTTLSRSIRLDGTGRAAVFNGTAACP